MDVLNDEVSLKIIEGLMNNKTQEEIAKELKISSKTVYNRVKLLEEFGYIREIKKGVWEVDYEKIGLNNMGVVLLAIYNDSDKLDMLIEHLKKLDFVEHIFEIISGEYNLCFTVRFKNTEEAVRESRKFLSWAKRHGIRFDGFKSYSAGKTHKNHRRSRF
jgi:DNA-binding Lrp family transcriptional regulator